MGQIVVALLVLVPTSGKKSCVARVYGAVILKETKIQLETGVTVQFAEPGVPGTEQSVILESAGQGAANAAV